MNQFSLLNRFMIRTGVFCLNLLWVSGLLHLLHVPGAFGWGMFAALVLQKQALRFMI